MKNLVIITFLSLAIAACNGQKRKAQEMTKGENTSVNASTDTTSNPKIDVRVNKKYDDKGNLIRYDSTYSYFYSSPGGITNRIGGDTLYNDFKSFFNQRYDTLFNRRMNDIFLNDSLYSYDFFNNDYFSKRFEMNMKSFEDVFQRMDSVKADYLEHSFPKGRIGKKNMPAPVID